MAEFTLTPLEEEQPSQFGLTPVEQVSKPTSETQESTTQEIAEGIASGLIAIPQGLAELGASAVDLALDTNYSTDVTNFADSIRDMAGIDPEHV